MAPTGIVSIAEDHRAEAAQSLFRVARALLVGGGRLDGAITQAEYEKLSDRTMRMLKQLPALAARGAPGTTTDTNYGQILSDWHTASRGWYGSLAGSSAFFAVLPDSLRIPMGGGQHASAIVTPVVAYTVGEGKPSPVGGMTLQTIALTPVKITAMIALTSEVVKLQTEQSVALVRNELSKAVVKAADAAFMSVAMAAPALSFAATGNVDADVAKLLGTVVVSGGSKPVMACGPDVGCLLSSKEPTGAMSPTGGTYRGTRVVVTDAMPVKTLRAFDAAGFAADASDTTLSISTQGDLDFGSPPSDPVTAATTRVSLFANNMKATKAMLYVAATRLRDSAAAEVTNVA